MKKIFWFIMAAGLVALTPARAQDNTPDAATDERLNKLTGYVQDLQDKTEAQRKQIEDLDRQIDALRDQLNKPGDTVTQDDLKKLADQVQEIDKKRETDKELILNQIKALGNISDTGTKTTHHHKPEVSDTPAPTTPTTSGTDTPPPNPNEKGFEYPVQAGDTISLIAKAYREKGVMVTSDQIIKANPGLKPNSLKVGQKIFIPAPPDAKTD